MNQQNQRPNVGILIFDGAEVLDFCGPFEVFATACPPQQPEDEHRLYNVITIAEEDRLIDCRGGLLVQPHATIDRHPPLDILVIPGGQGTRREIHNRKILDWIIQQNQQTQLTTSVCTGAFLLAENHLLDKHKATTHWGSINWLRTTYPAIQVISDARVVDEGKIITSAGVSAGIDMSLYVLSRLHGIETAEWTARQMEYDWVNRDNVLKQGV